MNGAVLIVPPLIKYLAGPMAGPAVLAGAAARIGIPARMVDLNAHFLRQHALCLPTSVLVSGDHARPAEGFRVAAEAFRRLLKDLMGAPMTGAAPGDDPVLALCYEMEAVYRGADRLADSLLGSDWSQLMDGPRPHLVGISLLWSGQVVPALAATLLARRLWPETPVVWGGPHVTALSNVIARSAAHGHMVDGFIPGTGEQVFEQMLTLKNPLAHPAMLRPGQGLLTPAEESWASPLFSDLHLYGVPSLVLPGKLARGCPYGRCAFCTYPALEGRYRPCSTAMLMPVLYMAKILGAYLSIKDAFLTPGRAEEVAQLVGGAVPWSACSRVLPAFANRGRMARLAKGGLRTLELGVESLDHGVQQLVRKQQNPEVLRSVLAAAAGLPVHLVLNVIHGWPGESLVRARRAQQDMINLVTEHRETSVSLEQNLLQLQPAAPLYRMRRQLGIRVTGRWPWASIVGWDAPTWRAEIGEEFRGHLHINGKRLQEAA